MKHRAVSFSGTDGSLEGLLHQGLQDKPAVVVCHPHPLYGGTMRNKVVYWMARSFEQQGHTVLRFNFRGVEQSDGAWDEGYGERDDVLSAMDYLQREHSATDMWLAGFSFGAYAGLQAARMDARVQRMFAVAPAVSLWDFSFMDGDARPLHVIAGTEDEIVPFVQIQSWVDTQPQASFSIIEGAGHFFPSHMGDLRQTMCSLITSA